MKIKWSAFFLLLSIPFVAIAQIPRRPPPLCNPVGSWKTVDTVTSVRGSALLAGMASYKNYAYAVGAAVLGIRETGGWVIRRSTDNGETWSTVKVLPGGGRGIAADPRNGILYSIGAVMVSDDEHSWVVQKSMDNGVSWTKVDDFYDREHFYNSGRITVDGKGNVIIVGQNSVSGSGGGISSIMRRSEDGGATWTTIDYAPSTFGAAQIASGKNGEVIVVGGTPSISPEVGGGKWMTMYSPDGKTNWKQVDSYIASSTDSTASSFAFGVSIHNNGNVVVVGNAGKTTSRTVVRQSKLSSIGSWSTVLTYRPSDRRLGVGWAAAAHILHMNATRYVINGRQQAPRSAIVDNFALDKHPYISALLTDKIPNPFPSPFQHEYVYSGGMTKPSDGLMLSGYIQDNESEKSWFIRKMTCPL